MPPWAGRRCVISTLAVTDVTADSLVVRETAPGVSRRAVRADRAALTSVELGRRELIGWLEPAQ